ncbi:divergent protein kinase domain 2A [Linepithema humile]|uniref:divergent protein kinase domain 2A n=1 Tax=Linepithema humile TaxID=83485 RepID=UPI00351E1EB6
MILYYIYNILKRKWKILFFVIYLLIIVYQMNIKSFLYPSITQYTEINKCPVCYGVSACFNIYEAELWREFTVVLIHLFDVKNAFFGTYNQTQVVLKKLAYSTELKAFDIAWCNKFHRQYPCSNILLDNYTTDFYDSIEQTITLNFSKDDASRLRLCPTVQHLDDFLRNVHLNNKHFINNTQYLINLWTLVSINPEPLILQILSAEDGWPVPKYFGACGRIVMEEYVGLPLSSYYDKPWIQRAKIVSSLLNAAYMFTFKDEKFGFYLTDISVDNIAIDHMKSEAKFIDLENIIVVDKNISHEDKPKEWEELQENTMHIHCPNCFAFSAEDICNHHLSDHNYYAICQLLSNSESEFSFPGGFLHDIPISIQQQYPNIENLLQQCAIPNSTNSTRITSGQQLKTLLDTIIERHYLNMNATKQIV